ncbi:juvenile hormone acid O-methyltransferase-like [Rhipicephalus sanguineus]|uniref:juvenile hormone acid O-methyltransferase-like n=1 Tax=Rhipicephalus sanguineus TaxID=34632 RepID=UPI0018935D3A|nr:juvenile hormone acid O-methyltransferase-like [Rhipicephalus sanguineus]
MSAQATAQNDSGEIQHHSRPNEDNVCLCVPEYAKHNQHQRKYNKFVLDFCQLAFSTEPDPSQQFLDVGCGTGDFTRDVLLPQCLPCGRIVGVDCNREMIEYARRNSAHEKLDFAVLDIGADVTEFLEEFGQFDRVYSFFCLNWVDDMTAAFKNIKRLLSPNGECLLVICAALQAPEAWKALAKIEGWAKYSEVCLKRRSKCGDQNI